VKKCLFQYDYQPLHKDYKTLTKAAPVAVVCGGRRALGKFCNQHFGVGDGVFLAGKD
jgi:hypothetical protein